MKKNLLVITGPTGVGKTNLSIDLAKLYRGEIISADSMQIYKYMDIGTAKIKDFEIDSIPHYMIDIVEPDKEFTVSNYRDLAKENILKVHEKSKLPIVVGGTGLYINSLVYDLQFASVPPNQELRNHYEKVAEEKGNDYLHKTLYAIDKTSAEKISIGDLKRIIRALEIYELTGKTMSQYNKNFRKESKDYNLCMYCLTMDRSRLYERINLRVDRMIEEGLIEEVKSLLERGYDPNLISLQGIGYKEIILYLKGNISLDNSVEIIKKASRNYAKRQLTWFRRDKRFNWVDIDNFKTYNDLVKYLTESINFILY